MLPKIGVIDPYVKPRCQRFGSRVLGLRPLLFRSAVLFGVQGFWAYGFSVFGGLGVWGLYTGFRGFGVEGFRVI